MEAKLDGKKADAQIIFVEDDDFFREITTQNLQDAGFSVVGFGCGQDALQYFHDGGRAQLALLDWKLPAFSGIELFRRLREEKIEIPTIFLTSLSSPVFEETALMNGAADFIDKTRSFSILLRRIHSALNSSGSTPRLASSKTVQGTLRVGDLELHLSSHRAFWKQKRINLTLAEFRIVYHMASNADQDLSHRDIYDIVRGEGFIAGDGADGYRTNVRTFIKRIRQKFGEVDEHFNRIATYSGFGYRWVADHAPAASALDLNSHSDLVAPDQVAGSELR